MKLTDPNDEFPHGICDFDAVMIRFFPLYEGIIVKTKEFVKAPFTACDINDN